MRYQSPQVWQFDLYFIILFSFVFASQRKSVGSKEKSAGRTKESTSTKLSGVAATNSTTREVNPVTARILKRSRNPDSTETLQHEAIARRAIGKGIRHSFTTPMISQLSQNKAPMQRLDCVSELEMNYRSSLNQLHATIGTDTPAPPTTEDSSLTSDSSLVNLAMIPEVGLEENSEIGEIFTDEMVGLTFIDFPNPGEERQA